MHKLPGSAVCTWCSSVQSGGESSTQLAGVCSCVFSVHKLPGSVVCTWCSSVQSGGESSTQLAGVCVAVCSVCTSCLGLLCVPGAAVCRVVVSRRHSSLV